MKEEQLREWSPTDDESLEPDPNSRAWLVYAQPILRISATELGNFRTCRLPKCRRMRQCTGRHPLERIGTDHWSSFPPCVDTNDKQSALMTRTRRRADEMERQLIARGIEIDSP